MKKSLIILFQFFFCSLSYSQEVISTQGNSYTTSGFSLDFTIGEILINEYMIGSVILSQGIHQPSWEIVGVKDHFTDINVTVFPNPTSSVLNIKTNEIVNVDYIIVDSKGVSVMKGTVREEHTVIELNFLSPEIYFLILKKGRQKLKSITILKH